MLSVTSSLRVLCLVSTGSQRELLSERRYKREEDRSESSSS